MVGLIGGLAERRYRLISTVATLALLLMTLSGLVTTPSQAKEPSAAAQPAKSAAPLSASYVRWVAQTINGVALKYPTASDIVRVWLNSDASGGDLACAEYHVLGTTTYTKVCGVADTSYPGANWHLDIPAQAAFAGVEYQIFTRTSGGSEANFSGFRYSYSVRGAQDWNMILHDSFSPSYRTPFGAVPAGTAVTLTIRVKASDYSTATLRVYYSRHIGLPAGINAGPNDLPMTNAGSQNGYDYWQLRYSTPLTQVLAYYRFKLEAAGGITDWYNDNYVGDKDNVNKGGDGVISHQAEPGDGAYLLSVSKPGFTTPDWMKDAVIYQIFPDRFRNGDRSNDELANLQTFYGNIQSFLHTRWNEPPEDFRDTGFGGRDFFGGDLEGVRQELPYLKARGFNTIYFNPIFAARSNHRYDTDNYKQIDPILGDNAKFQQLATEAYQQYGIRIILDGVFNHSSSDGLYFDRYHRYATVGACEAANASESPYFNWFTFSAGTPPTTCAAGNYRGWYGFDSIPEMNKQDPTLRDYLYRTVVSATGTTTANNVTKLWYNLGASGWRYDVADDPSFGNMWTDLRTYAKQYNPDGVLIAERWPYAADWLLGDELDGTMNYRFRTSVLGFARYPYDFTDNDLNGAGTLYAFKPSEFDHSLRAIREDYPLPAQYASMNLLGTHDNTRVLELLRLPGQEVTGTNGTVNPNTEPKQRLRLAAAFQYTYLGAPTTYYGDEAGLYAADRNGEDDPYNRAPFPWSDYGTGTYGPYDSELANYYQKLGYIRSQLPSLRSGDFTTVITDDVKLVYGYARTNNSETVVTVMNNGMTGTQVITVPLAGLPNLGNSVATATPCSLSFSDVPPTNIFYADIQFLACRGISSGFVGGTFQPNSNIRRGEFAKLAAIGLGIPTFTPTSPTFSDVPPSNIFYAYIEAAVHAGVILGGPCGTANCFRPNDFIRRSESALIIVRAKQYPTFTPTSPTFTDVPSSFFAYAAIETLAHNGVVNGAPCGTTACFFPNSFIKRGEMAKVLHRAIGDAINGSVLYDVLNGNAQYTISGNQIVITLPARGVAILSSRQVFPAPISTPTPPSTATFTATPSVTGTPPTATNTRTTVPTNSPTASATATATPNPNNVVSLVTGTLVLSQDLDMSTTAGVGSLNATLAGQAFGKNGYVVIDRNGPTGFGGCPCTPGPNAADYSTLTGTLFSGVRYTITRGSGLQANNPAPQSGGSIKLDGSNPIYSGIYDNGDDPANGISQTLVIQLSGLPTTPVRLTVHNGNNPGNGGRSGVMVVNNGGADDPADRSNISVGGGQGAVTQWLLQGSTSAQIIEYKLGTNGNMPVSGFFLDVDAAGTATSTATPSSTATPGGPTITPTGTATSTPTRTSTATPVSNGITLTANLVLTQDLNLSSAAGVGSLNAQLNGQAFGKNGYIVLNRNGSGAFNGCPANCPPGPTISDTTTLTGTIFSGVRYTITRGSGLFQQVITQAGASSRIDSGASVASGLYDNGGDGNNQSLKIQLSGLPNTPYRLTVFNGNNPGGGTRSGTMVITNTSGVTVIDPADKQPLSYPEGGGAVTQWVVNGSTDVAVFELVDGNSGNAPLSAILFDAGSGTLPTATFTPAGTSTFTPTATATPTRTSTATTVAGSVVTLTASLVLTQDLNLSSAAGVGSLNAQLGGQAFGKNGYIVLNRNGSGAFNACPANCPPGPTALDYSNLTGTLFSTVRYTITQGSGLFQQTVTQTGASTQLDGGPAVGSGLYDAGGSPTSAIQLGGLPTTSFRLTIFTVNNPGNGSRSGTFVVRNGGPNDVADEQAVTVAVGGGFVTQWTLVGSSTASILQLSGNVPISAILFDQP